ncbi:uncharacterized protein METZ01_LOCUS98876, partial [marine metagenome]
NCNIISDSDVTPSSNFSNTPTDTLACMTFQKPTYEFDYKIFAPN